MWDVVQGIMCYHCGNGKQDVLIGWSLGWGRVFLCPPLHAASLTSGDFCRQIPTTAAASLLAMVGSALQNPRGQLALLSFPIPAGSLRAGQGH